MDDALLILHELLCLALFCTVFRRLVVCSDIVRADVRLAFFALGVVACSGMVAPLSFCFAPSPFSSALLAAVCLVEMVTAHHWRAGVPEQFYRPGCAPRMRRATDCTKGFAK